jgi:hypothetical protein
MGQTFLEESLSVLERTPVVLDSLLRGLAAGWTGADEGPGTWSPYVVVGHLVHLEKTDWMVRLGIILEHGTARPFDPVDREAQMRSGGERALGEMLDEFAVLRRENLARLRALELSEEQLAREGRHPGLGVVTARQLLATWTAHDLAHLVQVGRVMAKRYRGEVGPWAQYLSVMS